jgi:hypothetical protein
VDGEGEKKERGKGPESQRQAEGIRMVSASTKKDSGEEERREREREEVVMINEKVSRIELPPRLESGLVPTMSPIREMDSTGMGSYAVDLEKR